MRRLSLLVFSALSLWHPAFGCSPVQVRPFEPTLENWLPHFADDGSWVPLPAPTIEKIEVTRGQDEPSTDCMAIGTITLSVSLPPSSTYDINEFGFYFRIVRGSQPKSATVDLPGSPIPDVPVIGYLEDDTAVLTFVWVDGHPRNQEPIDLELEVFLVTNGLNLGPATRISIADGIAGA